MDENLDLEYLNFRNQVWFYRNELRRIMKGESYADIFTHFEGRRLKTVGILMKGMRGHPAQVSERAERLLNEFEEEAPQ